MVNNDSSPIKRWSASIYLEYELAYDQLSDSSYRMLTMMSVMLCKPQKLPLRILAASVLFSWPDPLAGEPHWQTLSVEWSNRASLLSQGFSCLCRGVRIWMVRSGRTQHQVTSLDTKGHRCLLLKPCQNSLLTDMWAKWMIVVFSN